MPRRQVFFGKPRSEPKDSNKIKRRRMRKINENTKEKTNKKRAEGCLQCTDKHRGKPNKLGPTTQSQSSFIRLISLRVLLGLNAVCYSVKRTPAARGCHKGWPNHLLPLSTFIFSSYHTHISLMIFVHLLVASVSSMVSSNELTLCVISRKLRMF